MGTILGPNGLPASGLSAEDRWVLTVLDNYVRLAKREGMLGSEALARMAFQALLGLYEVGKQEGGEVRGRELVRHLLNEYAKVMETRGQKFVFRLVPRIEVERS